MITLSLVWGILAAIGMGVAFLPCFGSLNWLNIPFAGIGLVLSIIALVNAKAEPKGGAIAGIVLCGLALLFGTIRLIVGGGLV